MNNLAIKNKSPLASFANRFDVDPDVMEKTLKTTVFKLQGTEEVSNEQMIALMIVADQHHLNPFTKEIYAFPDKSGGVVPVVGVDGWSRLINSNKNFDGMDFRSSDNMIKIDDGKSCPEWMECIMYRKDRTRPVIIREYLDEVYRASFQGKNRNTGQSYSIDGPWQSHTKRMLRHKVMIQCARLAFGFTGIYDEDEAERMIAANDSDITDIEYQEVKPDPDVLKSRVTAIKDKIIHKNEPEATKEAASDDKFNEGPDISAKGKTALKGKINKCRSLNSLEDLLPECMYFSNTEWHEELRQAYSQKKKALSD